MQSILSERERKILHAIRKIRNAFAHDHRLTSFGDKSINDLVKNIRLPKEMILPDEIPLPKPGSNSLPLIIYRSRSDRPREIFEETVIALVNILSARYSQAITSRRKSPAEFKSASEIADLMANLAEKIDQQLRRANIQMESLDADKCRQRDNRDLHEKTDILVASHRHLAEQLRHAIYKDKQGD